MSDRKNSETTSWNAEQVRRHSSGSGSAGNSGSSGRKHNKQRNKARNRTIYIACVLLASCLLAGIGWLMVNDVCALNKPYQEATVVVEKGDSVGAVASKLKDAGLIDSKMLFLFFGGVFFDAKETISPGTYKLDTDMDFHALINAMQSEYSIVPAGVVQVTIPEGYTVMETFALLEEKGVCSQEDLVETAKNYVFENFSFIDNENLGSVSRLEGFLAPDTYEFFEDEAPEQAISRLLENFSAWMNEERMAAVEASGYSLQEIITIASLIEKETDGSDYAQIASVIYNRMDNPGYETAGLLQIDAALLYALPDHEGAITAEDKEVDSPYNLYLNPGLPPTPIANPGIAAIDAALNPADTNYYYYALSKDGTHHFSTSLAEHNAFLNSGEYGG